jgi:catechol 2,3-dioxygenase-like lactoylglutathione lyase family enzyme
MARRIFCTLLLAGAVLFAGPQPLVKGVDSIGLTVSDLDRSVAFYSYERLTGVFGLRMRTARIRLGEEYIELTEFLAPRGRPAPVDARSNDRWFQHIAIIVSDMDRAYRWLREHKAQACVARAAAPARLEQERRRNSRVLFPGSGRPSARSVVVSSGQGQSEVARCQRQIVSGNRSHGSGHFGDRSKFEVLSGPARNGSGRRE